MHEDADEDEVMQSLAFRRCLVRRGCCGSAPCSGPQRGSSSLLRRAGLKVKEDIKVGDKYVFAYNPSRNGSNTGFLRVLWIGEKRIGISGNG